MNDEIHIYFAKFLVCPRYFEYIRHILKTTIKTKLVDVRFYVLRSKWFDRVDLTVEQAFDDIKLFVARFSVGLKPEIRQDFIDDYHFIGKC